MGEHLAQEYGGKPVVFRGNAHFCIHIPADEIHPPLVQPEIHPGVAELGAGGQDGLQLLDPLGAILGHALG